VRGDIDGVDRQTADTYTTIDGAGALSTKPEMIAACAQERPGSGRSNWRNSRRECMVRWRY